MLELFVRRRRYEAEGIISLELGGLSDEALPYAPPGSHIDLYLPSGLVRQYSLFQPSEDTNAYHLAVQLDANSRGGSKEVHAGLREGLKVRASLPRANFRIADFDSPSVLYAGGIGVTPLLHMAHALHRHRPKSFQLHYSARSRKRMAFRNYLCAVPWEDRVALYEDDGVEAGQFDVEQNVHLWDGRSQLYVCGPAGFMDAVVGTATKKGWPASNVHLERFGASEIVAGESFCVHAIRSGVTVQVSGSETIASALTAAGLAVPLSCEQGICGTCLTQVIKGVPDHRDQFQTDDEKAQNDRIAVCCSRALTPDIELDI